MRKLTVVHCLIGLAASMTAVGLARGSTTWRDLVVVIPVVVATAIAFVKPFWGANAAMPLFVFWLMPAVVLSLEVLGVVEIPQQHYGSTYPWVPEPSAMIKALSALKLFVTTLFCFAGIITALPLVRTLSWPQRALWFVGFEVLQFVFILISLMSMGPVPII